MAKLGLLPAHFATCLYLCKRKVVLKIAIW